MKYFFLILPVCALMACGGTDSNTSEDSTAATSNTGSTAPVTKEFGMLNFGTTTIVKGGAGLDMTAEEIKKLQGTDSLDSDDELYLTYFYLLGSEESNQYTIEFSIDSETKKVWQIYYDINTPDSAGGRALYNDIVNNFNSKYGQGKDADYGKYDAFEWNTKINGIATKVSVDRSTTSNYGSLSVYFDHAEVE